MQDDGNWLSDTKSLSLFLNARFSPHKQIEPPSRALPSWGRDQIREAATFYGVDPVFVEVKDAEEDLTY